MPSMCGYHVLPSHVIATTLLLPLLLQLPPARHHVLTHLAHGMATTCHRSSVAVAPANFRLEPEPEPATMLAEPSRRVEAATLAEPSRASFGHAKPAEPC